MKRIALFLLLAVPAKALPPACPQAYNAPAPYFNTLWGDNWHPQLSAGALFDLHANPITAFTNASLVYHSAAQGPTIPFAPSSLQPYIPDVGYSLLNFGAGGGAGTYRVGPGASVNFLGWVQGKAAQALQSSSSSSLSSFGKLIAPSPDGSGLNGGAQFTGTIIRNGTVLPLNHENWTPGWFVGFLKKI